MSWLTGRGPRYAAYWQLPCRYRSVRPRCAWPGRCFDAESGGGPVKAIIDDGHSGDALVQGLTRLYNYGCSTRDNVVPLRKGRAESRAVQKMDQASICPCISRCSNCFLVAGEIDRCSHMSEGKI